MERLAVLLAITLPPEAVRAREPLLVWLTLPKLISPLLAVREILPLPLFNSVTLRASGLVNEKLPALLLTERLVEPVPAWVTEREFLEASLIAGLLTIKIPPA
jgi:hypothetical protein